MPVRLAMTKRDQSPDAPDLLLAALEAVTGALRAVEAMAASPGQVSDGERSRRQHLGKAAEHLRAAISELRSANQVPEHPGAAGFVLATPGGREQRGRRAGPGSAE
jgi:hypothetical protein